MQRDDLYLDLVKGCLGRSLFGPELRTVELPGWSGRVWNAYTSYRKRPHWRIVRPVEASAQDRAEGKERRRDGETMIGPKRLDNIQACVTAVLEQNVPGDLIEAGVWRGGAAILMRAVLAARDVSDRTVWLADSFEGMPTPNTDEYPLDELDLSDNEELAVGVEQVKANFARYGLLDDQVKFLVGWFKDTLPNAPIGQLALVRLDADMYESTMDAITALYPKLAVGGYLIVDDYGSWQGCRQAIDDYRQSNAITEPIEAIDWTGVYWRRER